MDSRRRTELLYCLKLLLKPIVRFCVKHSFHIQELTEASKAAFIEVAKEDLEKATDKLSVCKLSAFTGMHRRDVSRIYTHEELKTDAQSLVSRVIGQWQQSKKFRNKSGKPRVLKIDEKRDEFKDLVESITKEVTPGTVLYELERLGAVAKSRDGLKLVVRAYIPKGNIKESYELLQNDVDDLIKAVDGNLFGEKEEYNLHVKTHYDRIPVKHFSTIRDWLAREGSALHQKARNFLSQYDLDIGGKAEKDSQVGRVALGSYSLVESPLQENSQKEPL